MINLFFLIDSRIRLTDPLRQKTSVIPESDAMSLKTVFIVVLFHVRFFCFTLKLSPVGTDIPDNVAVFGNPPIA